MHGYIELPYSLNCYEYLFANQTVTAVNQWMTPKNRLILNLKAMGCVIYYVIHVVINSAQLSIDKRTGSLLGRMNSQWQLEV